MKIQPISCSPTTVKNYIRKNEKPDTEITQPSFKGKKGTLWGTAAGGGLTALGVTAVAGPAALPIFATYVAINGILGAVAGHLVEKKLKEDKME